MKNSHDVFFRSIFSTTEKVEKLLSTILTKDILDIFDLSSLKIEPSVVVKKSEMRADMVLSVMLKDSNQRTKIILILDHKSWPDKDVIQQLQKYQLMIVNEHRRNKNEFPFPVLCVIFYHGNKRWKSPSSLQEDWVSRGFFSEDAIKKLSPYLMNFKPYLFDLSKFDISKQAIDSMKSILYALEDIWLLKRCRSRRERKLVLYKILSSVKKDLKNESKQYKIDVLLAIKQYFMDYDSQINEGLFKESSKEVTEKLGGENIMEELDYTMASVIHKARQEAIKEGREEGIQEKQKEITLKLLKADMSVEKVSEITGLSKQEIQKFQENIKK